MKLVAKTGTYVNQQGESKNNWVTIGVLQSANNGMYALIDPAVNLAGVLIKQNAMAVKEGKPVRDMVMVSVFDDQKQQPAQPQQQFQQAQPQGGYQQNPQQYQPAPNDGGDFEDDIPF